MDACTESILLKYVSKDVLSIMDDTRQKLVLNELVI